MPNTCHRLVVAVGAAVILLGCQLPATKRDRIHIQEERNVFGLYVPASDLVMVFPKGDLSPQDAKTGGSASSPRYFLFGNSSGSLIVSGWFEPASRFTSAKQVWETDTAAWKEQSRPEPREIRFEKIGGWDGVIYTTSIGPVARRHIRAHWVQDGTWIDLHISVGIEAEQRGRDFLSTIQIVNSRSR
jgi:hypothetical protein